MDPSKAEKLPLVADLTSKEATVYEGWDDPLIFTKIPDASARDSKDTHQSLLPNREHRQNKFATFFTPAPLDDINKTIENPVVRFSPLHEDMSGQVIPPARKGFRMDKSGASIDDLLGFVRYVFANGPPRCRQLANSHLMYACSSVQQMNVTAPFQRAVYSLSLSDSKFKNFVKFGRAKEDTINALYLLMQWGDVKATKEEFTANGFIYKGLLKFTSLMLSMCIEAMSGRAIKRIRINMTTDGKRLAEASEHLNECLKEYNSAKVQRLITIQPPVSTLNEQEPYVREVRIYPSQILDYLIKKGVLNENVRDNLYADLFDENTSNSIKLKVKFDGLVNRPGLITFYSKSGAKVAQTELVNRTFFRIESGDPSFLMKWEPIEAKIKNARVIIPSNTGKKDFVIMVGNPSNTSRKNQYVLQGTNEGVKAIVTVNSPSNAKRRDTTTVVDASNSKEAADLNKDDAKTLIDKMCITFKRMKGSEKKEICFDFDDKKSIYSTILKRFIFEMFTARETVDAVETVISTYESHDYSRIEGSNDTLKDMGLDPNKRYFFGQITVAAVVDPMVGGRTLVSLYHQYRRKYENR